MALADTTTPAATRPSTRLDSLTSLRFFAALAVVLYHGGEFVWKGGAPATSLGYTGVSFFFVLSGFVLAWSQPRDQPVATFYRNRAARIGPLHVLTWLVAVVAFGGTVTGSLAALLLVQSWSPNASAYLAGNAVSWSLSCEVFFYACFPVIAFLVHRVKREQRLLGVALGLMTLVGLAQFLLTPSRKVFWAGYVFPGYRMGEFVIGVVAAVAIRRGWRPARTPPEALAAVIGAWVLLTVAGLGFGVPATRFGQATPALGDVIMAPLFLYLIASVAGHDIEGRPWLAYRPLVRLGQWSFALYMIHQPLMRAAARAGLTGPAVFAVCVVLSVAGSGLVYREFERPMEARFRRRRPAPWSRVDPPLPVLRLVRPTASPEARSPRERRPSVRNAG